MDYEELANLTNSTQDITAEESYQFLAHEIIFAIFCLAGICADIAIIYTIFFYKRMHTIPNIFLANWAIADLLCLLATPSAYRIISVLDHISLSRTFMCVLFEFGRSLHANVITFVFFATLEWALGAFWRRGSEKFRAYYKYIIGGLWVSLVIMCGVMLGLCISRTYIRSIMEEYMLGSYCSLALLVIALQITRGVQKCRLRPVEYPMQMLTLATAYTLSYIIAILNLLILHWTQTYHPMLAMISACFIFSSSIVNFAILYKTNNDFQACFLQVLKRSGPRYEESISEFNNPISGSNSNANNKFSSVQVSFHNPSGELLTNVY